MTATPANYGTGKRIWFVSTGKLSTQCLKDKLGRTRKFKTYEAAQRAADVHNSEGSAND